jgi:5-oxoprolinase (ATP-hydrolysing)
MTILTVPELSIRVAIDRGGTFTDVHASVVDSAAPSGRSEFVIKLLSQDPGNYADAPTEGIRRVLERVTGTSIPRGQPLPVKHLGKLSSCVNS